MCCRDLDAALAVVRERIEKQQQDGDNSSGCQRYQQNMKNFYAKEDEKGEDLLIRNYVSCTISP